MFFLYGGPSQLDTWDPKPAAPAEIRGEFRPISTSVPGIQICEHLPRLAQLAHRFSLVRTMAHRVVNHNAAAYYLSTGQPPLRAVNSLSISDNDFPHLGAQIVLGTHRKKPVPPAVALPDLARDGPYITPGQNGDFLGARYAPLRIDGDPSSADFMVGGLTASPESERSRLQARQKLLDQMNGQPGLLAENHGARELRDYQGRALSLLTSEATRRAFEISREPWRSREQYGMHKYGQSLLLARRLVEAGVRLVTVWWEAHINNPRNNQKIDWDTHNDLFSLYKDKFLPPFDQCLAAFLSDLDQRGLLASTLVVCLGEFGRTPRIGQRTIGGANDSGRDHWPHCYSLLLAGGPAGGGRVLGKSDRWGAYPSQDPFSPQELQATLLDASGVNPSQEVRDGFGRIVPLSTGRVRRELFGT